MAYSSGNIFDLGHLERLAIRDTGRLAAVYHKPAAVVHIYPASLATGNILCHRKKQHKLRELYLPVGEGGRYDVNTFRAFIRYIVKLYGLLTICPRAEIYFFSEQDDTVWALAAMILSRFLGKHITLHDYSFSRKVYGGGKRMIMSMADTYIVGGEVPDQCRRYLKVPLSYRLFGYDRREYAHLYKTGAVPRVMVYGDFSRGTIRALAMKALELTKAKYPRTEFTVISPLKSDDRFIQDRGMGYRAFRDEAELSLLFKEHDTLLLLNPGGLNRYFAIRAAIAGYPVITNGFDLWQDSPDKGGQVIAIRDSYTALSDELIRLVENEEYYCSFARLQRDL